MFLVLNSMLPFPAPCAVYGSGCPGKRIWNAKCYACKDIPGYCVSLGMSVSCWAKPLRETYTRPRLVPTDLFLIFVSSQRVYWKNDE